MSDAEKKLIRWHLVNSCLAGLLVFIGSFVSAGVTPQGILISLATALIVAVSKFKDFWNTQEPPSSKGGQTKLMLFTFV